jgi:hypothetical protein
LSARLAQLSQSGENHQHAGAPDAGGIRVGKHAQVPGEHVVGFEIGYERDIGMAGDRRGKLFHCCGFSTG